MTEFGSRLEDSVLSELLIQGFWNFGHGSQPALSLLLLLGMREGTGPPLSRSSTPSRNSSEWSLGCSEIGGQANN